MIQIELKAASPNIERVENVTPGKRKAPTSARLLDALRSFEQEGQIEASIDEIAARVRTLGGAKHWWEDRIRTAEVYEVMSYLIGSEQIIPRYHIDYTSHDRSGNPVKKLLLRLAPEKTFDQP